MMTQMEMCMRASRLAVLHTTNGAIEKMDAGHAYCRSYIDSLAELPGDQFDAAVDRVRDELVATYNALRAAELAQGEASCNR